MSCYCEKILPVQSISNVVAGETHTFLPMTGNNKIMNDIMLGQSFEKGMYHSISAKNRFLYLRFLPQLARMITCDSRFLPLTLPKTLFTECNYADEGVLKDPKVGPKMINYVGLIIDYAKTYKFSISNFS